VRKFIDFIVDSLGNTEASRTDLAARSKTKTAAAS
jgi:hypothetical protein